MFQMFQSLQKNQSNPREMINNMIEKYTPEQMQQFKQFANGFGISDEKLNDFGINVK